MKRTLAFIAGLSAIAQGQPPRETMAALSLTATQRSETRSTLHSPASNVSNSVKKCSPVAVGAVSGGKRMGSIQTNTPANTPSFPFIGIFLQTVDRVTERLGLHVPPIADVGQLRQLAPGTLGRSLVDFLDSNHLDPFSAGPRRKQLHDVVHVLTGYGSDPIGEAEVQAFLLGAKFHPLNIGILMGLLGVLRRHRAVGAIAPSPAQVRQRLQRAYQRGWRSHFDVDTWQPETQWAKPLSEVRATFNL